MRRRRRTTRRRYRTNPANTNSDKMLMKALWPSILGIVICMILLCGTTFAWLTDSVHTGGSKLTAGHFSAEMSVNGTVAGTQATLQGPNEYVVKITKNGNVQDGYAIITINSQSYLISSFPAETKLQTSETGRITVSITPYWGTNKPSMAELLPEIPVAASVDMMEGGSLHEVE